MIPSSKLTAVFATMLGWPYVSPGSSDSRGIDCSGAFVYAYRQFSESIYHGSNRMIRVFCHDVKPVTNASASVVGMAIFKQRTDTSGMKDEYKVGGRYYDPALPNDYYHVGLVTSVSPLQIINATPAVVQISTDLKKWSCAGFLNAVDYGSTEPPIPPPVTPPVNPPLANETATTFAATGSTVNLRSEASTNAVVLVRVPLGEKVSVLAVTNAQWWRVRYEKTTGYMMSEFLRADA